MTEALADRFNALSRTELEGIRDFIILHYHLNAREGEPFWDGCRTLDIPESLASRIALFRENATAFQASDELFRVDSWVQVMLGQGLHPRAHHRLGSMIGRERLDRSLSDMARGVKQAVAGLPSHQAFLDHLAAPVPA